eukprot:NODE_736_length_4706_cov_0.180161.p4 type:complete len:102 gc:universal NODE_736_length_4706_cov_0.180161:3915-3610(-)
MNIGQRTPTSRGYAEFRVLIKLIKELEGLFSKESTTHLICSLEAFMRLVNCSLKEPDLMTLLISGICRQLSLNLASVQNPLSASNSLDIAIHISGLWLLSL